MKRNIILLIAFVLSACSPSETAIQTAMASTQAAYTPTPEPTPVPLTAIDLSDVLVMSGDLPAGYSPAQIRDEPSLRYREVPQADKAISMQLEQSGEMGGWVTVFLYEDADAVLPAYEALLGTMEIEGAKSIEGIGEQAFGYEMNFQNMLIATELAFTRCAVVAHIQFDWLKDLAAATAYAKRLDGRLAELVCR